MVQKQDVLELFEKTQIDPSWAFADKTRKDTTYATHGYHRYPAKFIPQIVSRLAQIYTQEGDLIVDPFGGCGTTLVESKVMRRPSLGVDINPVAVLMAQAKTTPHHPDDIERCFEDLKARMSSFNGNTRVKAPAHDRIDYWFQHQQKTQLAFLFSEISKIPDHKARDFFYCGFSNILKNCSIWLQKSNKPTRDLNKKPADPFVAFHRHARAMLRGNADFFRILEKRDSLHIPCEVSCTDARTIPTDSESVSLIVTSPPYVTSYEYADLHQLTALWFEYTKDLSDFRKRFIGTTHHNKKELMLNSEIAEHITKALMSKDEKIQREVATYFGEMNQVFKEMKRILKKGGRACIVIGNTHLKGVGILNAEVFVEQLLNLGFVVDDIIQEGNPLQKSSLHEG